MKPLFLLLIFTLLIPCASYGQSFATTTPPSGTFHEYYASNSPATKKPAKLDALGIVGGCSAGAGAVIYTFGLIKIGTGVESKVNTGHSMETVGITLAAAGFVMIVVDMIHQSSQRHKKVEPISPKSNELGLVYRF